MFLSASHSIINELDRQLEEWRSCLPPDLQFGQYASGDEFVPPQPTRTRTTEERLRGFLMARYYTAKSIIYRPFVYRALHAPDPELLSEEDKTGASTAVGAALMHSIHSGLLHEPLTLLFHPINTWRRYDHALTTSAASCWTKGTDRVTAFSPWRCRSPWSQKARPLHLPCQTTGPWSSTSDNGSLRWARPCHRQWPEMMRFYGPYREHFHIRLANQYDQRIGKSHQALAAFHRRPASLQAPSTLFTV